MQEQVSTGLWHMIASAGPFPMSIMILLVIASILSWTVIISKWKLFKQAQLHNKNFLKAFRKAEQLPVIAAAVQQFPLSPLVAMFEFGYEEVDRQVKARGTVTNKLALERSLQLGHLQTMPASRHKGLYRSCVSTLRDWENRVKKPV